jgi:2-iminoacetate synthase ThiH
VEYLKTLAVSRLHLEGIENVQASWVTLRFGANDVGSVMIEENVVSAAGFLAKQRDKLCYSLLLAWPQGADPEIIGIVRQQAA